MTIAEVLAPISVDQFRQQHLGRQYMVIKGAKDRFRHIVLWKELDDVLSRLRATEDRVLLVKKGCGVPRASYVYTSPNDKVQYLIGHALLSNIADGATLVVNQVDELFPIVRELAESCEELFRVHVNPNLYAGWRTENGFGVHWDRHDTLIIQLVGRKRWTVWAPTRLHPLSSDEGSTVPKTSQNPKWEGMLESGDVLYMPRGWWHVACPADEPSLHVTLGIRLPTGMDMLHWIVDQLRDSVDVRRDVPFWMDIDERLTWVQSIGDLIANAVTTETIDHFLHHVSNPPHPRSLVRLPEANARSSPVIGDRVRLRLTSWKGLTADFRESGDKLSFRAAGISWQCDRAFRPALSLLHPISACTLADMTEAVNREAQPKLRAFVTALIVAKVLWAEPVRAGQEIPDPMVPRVSA